MQATDKATSKATDHLLYITILSIYIDRIITIPYYHLESNPVVLTMGKELWLGISALLILALYLNHKHFVSPNNERLIRYLYIVLIVIHTAAIVTNIWIIAFIAHGL